jgi:hypothetical protein
MHLAHPGMAHCNCRPLRAEAIKARGDDPTNWLDGGLIAGQSCGLVTAIAASCGAPHLR